MLLPFHYNTSFAASKIGYLSQSLRRLPSQAAAQTGFLRESFLPETLAPPRVERLKRLDIFQQTCYSEVRKEVNSQVHVSVDMRLVVSETTHNLNGEVTEC